jgi:hypothetical protein
MDYILLFDRYWGNAFLDYSIRKIDILPRLSVMLDNTRYPRGYMIQVGFLFFTVQITIWTKTMREFLKRERHPQNRYK